MGSFVGYAKAISAFFTLRGFPSPVDLSDPNNAACIKITNHKQEEEIAEQRYPLNSAILAKLETMTLSSFSVDSEKNLMFDMTCLGCFSDPRVREYAQKSYKKVDHHNYPLGKKVIKAFTADDFVFFDKSGNTLALCDISCLN